MDYSIEESYVVNPGKTNITIELTNSLTLNERAGITINNQPIEYTYEDNKIQIEIADYSGTIRFSAIPISKGNLAAVAKLNNKKGFFLSVDDYDVIGVAKIDSPTLILKVPEVTGSKEIPVNGIAFGNKTINLYVDNTFAGSIKSNKDGLYSTMIELPSTAQSGKTYVIKASLADDSSIVDEQKTKYDIGMPKVVKFEMHYNAHQASSIDLLATEGQVLKNMINPSREYYFDIQFENYEKLGDVYVMSYRNGEAYRLKAEPVDNNGNYKTSGRFGGDARSIPGTISLSYSTITDESELSRTLEYDELTDYWKNADISVKKNTDTEFESVFTFEDGEELTYQYQELSLEEAYDTFLNGYTNGTKAKKNLKIANSIQSVDDEEMEAVIEFGKDLAERYKENALSNAKDVYVLKDVKENKFTYIVWDSFKKAFKVEGIKFLGTAAIYENSIGIPWKESSAAWGFIASGAGIVVKAYNQSINLDNAVDDINTNNNLTADQKQIALKEVEDLRWKYAALDGLRVVSVAAQYAIQVGVTASLGPVAGIAVGFLAGQVFNSAINLAEKYLDKSLTYYSIGQVFTSWLIDPSGYVFDSLTFERIEGVTATAYWIENDDSSSFWNNKPSNDQYGTLWNAGEYSQANPLLTDEEGKYAWDVPDGWWRVKYEKDGYETTWSEWLPVPPPQLDVNVGLNPTGYTPTSFTLTYNANGGSGAPTAQTGNGDITISSIKPTRSGYTFLGWATSSSATSAQYQPGVSFNLTKNTTFYAVWKKNDTPSNPTANAKLNVKSSASVDYRANVTITATADNVPSGYVLAIYDGNFELSRGDNKAVSFKAGNMTANRTFTVKVIDPNNKAVQKDSNGAELSKNCEVKVNTGFFAKLIAFFRGLFGALPNVEIKP